MIYYFQIAIIGIEARVPDRFSSVAADLLFEFRHFQVVAPPAEIHVVLTLHAKTSMPEELRRKTIALLKTPMGKAYGLRRRVCRYPRGSVVALLRKKKKISASLYGDEESELTEVLRVLFLSLSGEALDRAGFHRIHALAWKYGEKIFLFSAPSGGGKSTLAWSFLHQYSHGWILSDETCLVSPAGDLHAFPMPVALKQKPDEGSFFQSSRTRGLRYRVELPRERICWQGPVHTVAVGTELGPDFAFRKMTLMDRFRFIARVTLGLGNTQMREFMLRGDVLWELPQIAFSRMKAAWRLLRRAETRSLRLSYRSPENLQFILLALANSQKSQGLTLRPSERKVF